MLDQRVRRVALVGGLALVSGCGPRTLFIPAEEIPESVDHLGLLPIVEGEVQPGSGLLPARGPAHGALELAAPTDPMVLVGYSAGELRVPSEARLASSPLRPALADEAQLPPPVWSTGLRFDGERAEFSASPVLGPLTADWVQCGIDPAELYVHVRCVSCSPFVELRREGCALTIDTRGCFLGVDTIQVPLGGASGFGTPTVPGERCTVLTDPGASELAFECTIPQTPFECRFDIVGRVPPEEVPYAVTRRALVSRPLAESSFVTRLEVYGQGYVHDLVLLGDRVIATVHDRAPSNWHCTDPQAGQLVVLDANSLETVSTATAPPCLYAMAPSTRADEFVALFGHPVPSVGRFDATGRRLEARPLSPRLPFEQARAVDLELRPDGMLVAMLNESADNIIQPELDAAWLLIDPNTLEITDLRRLEGNHALLRVSADGKSSAVHLDLESFVELDPEPPVYSDSFRFRCDAAALRVGDHIALGGARHLLLGRQLYPFVFAIDYEAETCARDAVAEYEADPSSFARVNEDLLLVTARGRDADHKATLLRMDARRHLFLPGALEIGNGLTRLRRIDAQGRIFGVAVESGHVFRIDPR